MQSVPLYFSLVTVSDDNKVVEVGKSDRTRMNERVSPSTSSRKDTIPLQIEVL
jgi:hypothetical protein